MPRSPRHRRTAPARRVAALLTSLTMCVGLAPAAPAGAAGGGNRPLQQPLVEAGIDVSRWQGTIDWPRVAASGITFAFIKATDGIDGSTWVDPVYATNVAGARAAGIVVGSYHFARPDLATPDDALVEARWFANNLDLQPGDLPPVLDIEVKDGLDTGQMTLWALEFLEELRRITGVSGLVYTSPAWWEREFADSTAIAQAGFGLWLAHWTRQDPRVPAGNWNGEGWTIWQYTSTGSVPGITGNVDRNWSSVPIRDIVVRGLSVTTAGAEGTVTSDPAGIDCGDHCDALYDPGTAVTLSTSAPVGSYLRGFTGDCTGRAGCVVTLDRDRAVAVDFGVDTTPATYEVQAPSSVADPIQVRFSENVSGVRLDDVLLTRPNGASVPVSISCHAGRGGEVPCDLGPVRRIEVRGVEPLAQAASFSLTIGGGPGAIHDRARNPVAPVAVPFVSPTEVEEGSGALTYAWRSARAQGASDGTYLVERQAGATLAFRFTGPVVRWITVTGPQFGRAEVLIDGILRGEVDLSGDEQTFGVQRVYRGLGPGEHEIVIRVTGERGADSDASHVAVDGFRVGRVAHPTPEVRMTWGTLADASASSGAAAVSGIAGSRVTFDFSGSRFVWHTFVGPSEGQAKVFVDGVLVRTVSNLARALGRKAWVFDGLAPGQHTVSIVVVGKGEAGSTGTRIAIDGFSFA